MSKNIMITWELGGGYGHLIPIIAICKKLILSDTIITLVLKDITNPILILLPKSIKIIQAPKSISPVDNKHTLSTVSDILFVNGYHSTKSIKHLLNQWIDIIDLVKPDVVINDYSPTAVIACKIKRIKNISIGTGFFIPPITKELIYFRDIEEVDINRSTFIESSILNSLNSIFLKSGLEKQYTSVIHCLRADKSFITTYPELDHYLGVRDLETENFIGNITFNIKNDIKIDYKKEDNSILLYIKNEYKYLIELLEELIVNNINVIAFINKPSKKVANLVKDTNVKIYSELLNLNEVLKVTSVFISNCGNSSVIQSIISGVPVVMLPMQQEQRMLSNIIQKANFGVVYNEKEIKNNFRFFITDFINKKMYKDNCILFSEKYVNDLNFTNNLDKISDLVMSI